MPDEVSVDDGVSQSEAAEVDAAAEAEQPITVKEAEEVKEQPVTEEEATTEPSDESASTETAAVDADALDESAPAEIAAVETEYREDAKAEEEPAQSPSSVSLKVDTTVENEAEAEITPIEPATQPLPVEAPATIPVRQSLYGSQHNWCPQVRKPLQQPAEGVEGMEQTITGQSDALSLSWVEQSIFACNAEQHSSITAFKSLLPPASSLPPFVPPSIAVIGPPLSGRTSLAKRLCSSFSLTYLSIPDVIASLASSYHPLSAQLSASLPAPPPLPLLLDCVEAALCGLSEVNEGTRGWVLDGFPNTREEAEAMQQRGLLPRQCINLTIVKRGGQQAEVAEVEKRWLAREEKERMEREQLQRLAAEKAAAAALAEQKEREQAIAAAAEEDGDAESDEAGGEEVEPAEQPAEPADEHVDEKTEEAEPADEQDSTDGADAEQSAEHNDESNEAATDATDNTVSTTTAHASMAEADATVLLTISVDSNGDVHAIIQTLPLPPVVPVDLLTPFIASLRTTLSAEQWSERVAEFSRLLDYMRRERLLSTITVPTSLWSAHRQASETISAFATARMAHLQALSAVLPSSLSSLPFSSARLSTDLSSFGLYCAVCWHEQAALEKLQPDSSDTRWVQYRGVLYAVSDQQVEQRFIADAARYHDASTFPSELPQPLVDEAGTAQLVHPLRYSGYCPVSIVRQQAREVLYINPGSSQHSALYRSRLYRFTSADALRLFLSFPNRYSDLSLPSPLPLPLHLQPLPLASDVVHSFLTLNFNARLASCLSTLSMQRSTLLYPGLSVQQSALIHLALQLRGVATRLQTFESECRLGREIAKEVDDAGHSEEVEMRHAAYDAIHVEVEDRDWQTVQKYVESKFFSIV